MYCLSKDRNRGPGSKSKAKRLPETELGFGQRTNPGQPPKHLDDAGEKKEEEALDDSMTQLQLENAPPTLKKKKKRCRTSKCSVCLRKGCDLSMCPYWSRIPPGVTIVAEGYELACRHCIRKDNMCGHNMSYARAIFCVNCNDYGHRVLDCPMPNMIRLIPS